MKLEYIIYDIKELLLALKDDTRVKDSYLIHKINNYNCLITEQMALQGLEIPEQCYSRLPKRKVHEITSGDHPDITVSSVRLGKVDVPKTMNLQDRDKEIKVLSSSRQSMIFRTSFPFLMHMIRANDNRLQLFNYYVIYGRSLYVYPYIAELDLMAVLEDPIEAFQINSEMFSVDQLKVGMEYIIYSGAIMEDNNGVQSVYKKYDGFTCQSDYTYSGDGKAMYDESVRQITMHDDYPITRSMAQQIVLQILTKDYQIEKQSIPDIYNDAMDDELTARLRLRRQQQQWSGPRAYPRGLQNVV